MKRLIQITLTIVLTLLGFFLLWLFGAAVTLFAASLALSAALRPIVQRMEARGIGRAAAILICYVVLLVVVGVLIFFSGLQLIADISNAAEQFPTRYQELRQAWLSGSTLQHGIAQGLPASADSLLNGSGFGLITGVLITIGSDLASIVLYVIAVLSLAFYWLTEVTRFERLWLSLLPVRLRVRARDIWRNTEAAVGTYIRVTLVAVLASSVLLYVLFSLLGMPFATLLALIGGISQLVPRVGPALSLLPPLLIALGMSPVTAVVVLVFGAAIHILIHHLDTRLIHSGAIKVNPLLQVLLLLALAEVGGLTAMVFAPPLTALIQMLYANVLGASTDTHPQESAFDLLCERLEHLREVVAPDNRELNSALQRSDDLITQARDMLGKSS